MDLNKSVIIIEDNILLLDTYKYHFKSFNNYTLKGAYTTIEDALLAHKYINPDIILSDISLPGMNGIEGLKKFKEINGKVKIIMASIHDDLSSIINAMKNKADGYLTKPIKKDELKNALDTVTAGGAPLSHDVSKKIIHTFHTKKLKLFSKRENQIIELLMKGYTYKDISNQIHLTHSTINYHIQNIYTKLNVTSKSKAIKKINEINLYK